MPKYEKLLQAWRDAKVRGEAYQNLCYDAAAQLCNDLQDYFGDPRAASQRTIGAASQSGGTSPGRSSRQLIAHLS